MKKLLFLLAATLPCFIAHSQEAEPAGSHAELTVIPHAEFIPNYDLSEKAAGFNFGNSSLYTSFEGNASEHFSWLLVNNWLTTVDAKDNFGWQYRALGYSNTTNWLIFCRADLNFGNWNISLGKDCIATGSFEFDDWDWDIQANFASPLWNSISSYQWGGKVAWTTPSEMTNLALQMVSSPCGERPFASCLWAYSAQWRGEYSWFSNIWSVSAVEYEKGRFDWVVSLGNRFTFDSWTITLDYNNNLGFEYGDLIRMLKGTTLNGTVNYSPSEKFDISLRGMWMNEGWNAGVLAYFYPLRESQDLKLHAGVCYDTFNQSASVNLGVRYNFRIHLW